VPVVPRQEETAVIPSPLPGVRVPTPPPGAFDYGSGVQKASGILAELQQDEKRKADEVVSLEKINQGWEANNILATSALRREGKDAIGITGPTLEQSDKQWTEIESQLTNDAQRAAVRRARQAKRHELTELLQRHEAAQYDKLDRSETEKAIVNFRSDAEADYRNPETVATNIARQRATYTDYATRHGLGEQEIQATLDDLTSKTHTGVVNRFLANGDDLTAKAYYDTNRTAITADDAIPLERALKEGSTNGAADRLSMDAVTKLMPTDKTAPMNLFDVMAAIRTQTQDVTVIKAAEGMAREFVENFNTRGRQLVDGRKQAVYKAAAEGIPAKDIYRMPEYLELGGVDQETFKQHVRAKKRVVDEATKTEQTTRWGDLISDPELLGTTDLNAELVSGRIDRPQFHSLTLAKDKQDPLKSDQAKNAIALIDRAGTQRIFNPADRAKNIEGWNKSKNVLQAYIRNNWNNPDYAPDEFALKLMEPVRESWAQWAIDKVSAGQPGLEAATAEKYRELSQEAGGDPRRQQAIDTLKAAGKPVTEANITFIMDRTK
jgi:hypothetical protein